MGTYRYILYKIDQESMKVVVESQGGPETSYEDFVKLLPEADCRYGVYDYDFEDKEGCKKSKIVFLAWSPDTAKVRAKMLYAATKDTFRRQLDGVHLEIQGTDLSEVELKVV